MKQIIISLYVVFLVNCVSAQEKSEVLLTVADESVTVEEFMHIYSKNNRNQELIFTIDSLKSYMDLFVNFKLKVAEAKAMGLDTLKSFKKEFSGYRSQLAQPYLTDKTVEEELIAEAYERMKYDVNASHILIKLDAEVSGKDTVKAYKKAMEVREKLLAREDFEKMAKKYSDDESVKYNSGNLGYFTVFGMVYPFETAAYNTPVGEISEIVRTRFGYHVLKVNDKRPAKGRIRVAHIMVLTPKEATQEQIVEAEKRVTMIQEKLDAGESFEDLAKEFSEDRRSAQDGGLLPWFGVGGKMIAEFENAAFQMTEIGQVSKALKTSYGYHFIKLVDVEPIGGFEDEKNDIKSKISNSARASRSKAVLVNRLKKEYNAKTDEAALVELMAQVTDSIFYGTWNPAKAMEMKKPILTFADEVYTQGDFAEYLSRFNRKSEHKILTHFVNQQFQNFVDAMILDYEEANLENKYPKFHYLLKEYHDGILLFDVTDKIVWSKAIKDSLGLQAFYDKNKQNYMWDTRYETRVLNVKDKKQSKSLLKELKKNPDMEWTEINERYNAQDSAMVRKEHWKTFNQGENDFIDKLVRKYEKSLSNDDSFVTQMDDGRLLVLKMIAPAPKKLDEARGLITADYQNYLEKQWIQNLREKYPVVINEDVLQKIAQNE
jgi:peptidyl-prolyl cis-trans isomerase SurA